MMQGIELFGAITLFGTVGVVAVCFVLYVRIMRKRHFKCAYCGEHFKVPATKSFIASSKGADRFLRCPYCGKSGYMEFTHDYDPADEETGDAPHDDVPDDSPESGDEGSGER